MYKYQLSTVNCFLGSKRENADIFLHLKMPPVVQVFSVSGVAQRSINVPTVFSAPVRSDIVQFVHTQVNKNKRQARAVSVKAGHQTSATSWGTGRAVARIPRVSGGGTHRAGQAAFGNMCRGGRMFAPTKVFRKWHVKVNLNQRRFATCSAVAASALAPLVMARGHRIDKVEEIPLVVENAIESLKKTKDAIALLTSLNAMQDVEKVQSSKKLRAGLGKLRNRRHTQRRGPLIIYNKDDGLVKAFRNIPGVEVASVNSLNILQLAPGGHVGRFVIWSSDAFKLLDSLYGSYTVGSTLKKNYSLPHPIISNADLPRLINSDEIQKVVRPAGQAIVKRPFTQRKNPLKNNGVLVRFNPYAQTLRRRELLTMANPDKVKKVKKHVKNKAFIASLLSE